MAERGSYSSPKPRSGAVGRVDRSERSASFETGGVYTHGGTSRGESPPVWPSASHPPHSLCSGEGKNARRPLPVDPLHFRHHGLRAELGDDRAEMLEVIDAEINRLLGKVRRAAVHADIVDVAVVIGDHLGDLRQ